MSDTPTTKKYTIREAARSLSLSEQYVRNAIRNGALVSEQEPINNGMQYRHVITEAELKKWRSRSANRSSRDDGRNKFVVYLTPAEEAKVRGALKELKLDAVSKLLVRANPPKGK